MFEGYSWIFFLTVALISASVIDDIRSRKVHNSLVVSTFVVALSSSFLYWGLAGWMQILTSIAASLIFCLPLYRVRALGGGDVKLLIALSPLMSWMTLGWTLAYSLVWGSILGVTIVLVNGQALTFFRNMTSLALQNPVTREQLHKMPYTVAILLGFLTQMMLEKKGVLLL